MDISPSSSSIVSLLTLLVFTSITTSWATSCSSFGDDFIHCISLYKPPNSIPIFIPHNSSFSSLLQSGARNLRFLSPTSSKPKYIITPLHESHVQATVVCSRKHGLDFKVRSGGHDLEGLSFVSDTPFVLVDLVDFRSIHIDAENSIAWIQAGANLGEVYYAIGEKSKTLGFPGGFCPTVGVGGHLSGGGIGSLVRKYGLAADHIVDARIVNANGEILDRESMGEDLFWAIRGGGASSFAVILSWKVKLVHVPARVTVAMIFKKHEEHAIDIIHRWQFVADRLPRDLYVGLTLAMINATAQAQFSILFLGDNINKLVELMEENFPELGLKNNDCIGMSWVESHVFFYARGNRLEYLLDRNEPLSKISVKAKSDHVKVPIPKKGLEGLWTMLKEEPIPVILIAPFGGKMNEIPEYETPFPHRVGNIYNILYVTNWFDKTEAEKHIDWMRRLYKYMTPYVSKSPRAAYVNYKDLDLGEYENGEVSYSKGKIWGIKYFMGNFDRLAQVKSKVDPDNFFKDKQSIPPIHS